MISINIFGLERMTCETLGALGGLTRFLEGVKSSFIGLRENGCRCNECNRDVTTIKPTRLSLAV